VDRLAILVGQHLYITISILLRWVMGLGGLIEEEDRINICQGAAEFASFTKEVSKRAAPLGLDHDGVPSA